MHEAYKKAILRLHEVVGGAVDYGEFKGTFENKTEFEHWKKRLAIPHLGHIVAYIQTHIPSYHEAQILLEILIRELQMSDKYTIDNFDFFIHYLYSIVEKIEDPYVKKEVCEITGSISRLDALLVDAMVHTMLLADAERSDARFQQESMFNALLEPNVRAIVLMARSYGIQRELESLIDGYNNVFANIRSHFARFSDEYIRSFKILFGLILDKLQSGDVHAGISSQFAARHPGNGYWTGFIGSGGGGGSSGGGDMHSRSEHATHPSIGFRSGFIGSGGGGGGGGSSARSGSARGSSARGSF